MMILYAILTGTGILFICFLILEICKPEKELFRKIPAKVNGKEYTYYTVLPHKEKPHVCLN